VDPPLTSDKTQNLSLLFLLGSAFGVPGLVNEYQLLLGRQRQVWLIPIADERVGVQVKP